MRQMILLEKHDLVTLKGGGTLTLNVNGLEMLVGLHQKGSKKEFKCPDCEKVYHIEGSYYSHILRRHGRKRSKK